MQVANKNPEIEFLRPTAEGLDLRDPEDRAIFRGRVEHALRLTRVDEIRTWIGANARDRYHVVRAVADAFIQQEIGSH